MSDKSNNPIADPAIRRLFEGKNLVFIASLMKDGSTGYSDMGRY